MKRNITTMLFVFVALIGNSLNCGFEKDEIEDTNIDINIENPTKYRTLFATACSYRVDFKVQIPDDYAHYRKDDHQASVMFGVGERPRFVRGTFNKWQSLYVTIPCGACGTEYMKGSVAVLDDEIYLMPWGCGRQRPPLLIDEVQASYIKPDANAVPISQADKAKWTDKPPQLYTYSYTPLITTDKTICGNAPVLFDLMQSCEVLVNAGVLARQK